MRRSGCCLLTLGVLLLAIGSASAEIRIVSWDPVTTYTDNTAIEAGKTVTYTMYWSTDPALPAASLRQIASGLTTTSTTFDPGLQGMTRGGTVYFTGKTVLGTGEESALSPAISWIVPIVTAPTLSSIAVSGAASVNEGATATYTATATWSDGSTSAVTPAWSVTTAYATISSSGLLTAATVSATQTVTVSASYTSGSVTRTASQSVSIVNVPPTLSSIAVSGAASVNEGATATYTATATWSDGSTSAVTPAWSVTTAYATISSSGLLTAATVSATQTVTVSASYTSGSVTRTASQSVSIVNVPSPSPAAPGNITIGGPVTGPPSETWRISWDPVTTYQSGAPLEGSRPVRYTVYWTRDPALTPGTLMPIASPVSATSIVFSPAASAMVHNERVYFAAVAVLADTGDPSLLSADLTWVVSNRGPSAPAAGSIKKK